MTDTLVDDAILNEMITSDEPEKTSHIVKPPDDGEYDSPQAYVLAARIEGFEIEALCGYRWVPQQDPASLPVCSKCYDLYQQGADKWGDRDKLPDA